MNNPLLYNALINGFSGGAVTSLWIPDLPASSFANTKAQAIAFATEVDSLIPAVTGGATPSQAQLLCAIAQAVMNRPAITGTLDYTDIAESIAAMFSEINAALNPIASGSDNPLSNVFVVDGGTTLPTAEQNGAIGAPYKTISQALAVALAGAVILVTPGTYAENLAFTHFVVVQAYGSLGGGNAIADSVTNALVSVENVTIAAGATATLNGVVASSATGADNTSSLTLNGSSILAATSGTPAIICTAAGEGIALVANDANVQGTMHLNSINTNNAILTCNTVTHYGGANPNGTSMLKTFFPTAVAWTYSGAAGHINVDPETNQSFIVESTITNGSITIYGDSANLEITTPVALLASAGGGFTNLVVYDASALDAKHKLEIGFDFTCTDAFTATVPVVTEFRANSTYYFTGGVVTLLESSPAFTSANIQVIVSGTNIEVQGAFNAGGGHTLNYVGSLYARFVKISP